MLTNFDENVEAARISFAGTLVALRATGVEVVEAKLDYPSDPILKIVPEQIMAGFDDQQFGKGHLKNCVGEHVPCENPSMYRRMLLAQVRSILAGKAALDFADITGALHLTDTPASASSEDWAIRLLGTFGEFLDIDEHTKDVLFEKIWQDANRAVGRNWDLVTWVYIFIREDDDDIAGKLHSDFFTKNAEDFPITASGADAFWRRAEKAAEDIYLED